MPVQINSHANTKNPFFIVTAGSLLNIDYTKTIAAFTEIAKRQQRKLDLNKMPLILKLDEACKAGKLTAEEFRIGVCTALDLKLSDDEQTSNKEFDAAWNAMLGDVTQYKTQLHALSSLYQVGVVSFTNPIHARHLKLDLYPYYLSYRLKCTGAALYEKYLVDAELNPTDVILLLPSRQLPGQSQPNNDTDLITWAKAHSIGVYSFNPEKEKIAALVKTLSEEIIRNYVEPNESTLPEETRPSMRI